MSVGNGTTTGFSVDNLSERLPSLIGGLGILLGLVLITELVLVHFQGMPFPDGFYIGVVTTVPIIAGLLYGGRWLRTSDISPEWYDRIGLWCLAGLLGFSLFITLVTISAGSQSLIGIVSTLRWSISVGAGLGMVIGVFDARAVHQAFEAGIAQRREAETRRERDRLDQFASVISHDLRNPLNVAQGRLQLAEEEVDSEHLEAVAQAHARMDTLIEDVLSLARAGEAIGEVQSIELANVVEVSWKQVQTNGATLEIRTEARVLADRSRLQQLLENLFRNAIEHAGNQPTITVGDLPNGFYVEDDGPGIPESEREEVLDPGYTTSDSGTGFGLSIVRDIAAAHDWEITITSGADGGARFEFTGVQSGHSSF